jgi:hypothetical protein
MFRILGLDCIRGVRLRLRSNAALETGDLRFLHVQDGMSHRSSVSRACVQPAGFDSLAERHMVSDAGETRFPDQGGW